MLLIVQALLFRVNAVKEQMEEGFLGMGKLSKKLKQKKADRKMKKQLYKQMKGDLKKDLNREMTKLRNEEAMDEGYESGHKPWDHKRGVFGRNDHGRHRGGRGHTHEVDDKTLRKLENKLEHQVLDDLRAFEEQVEAY
uniref:Uncharacterized protein n=2 Tax=Theileria parva TaxID=5875 RepID=Q4N0Q3_THEPA|eukprot:XP_763079.1 hypothetical protein [Theileria parva strain Muguga]